MLCHGAARSRWEATRTPSGQRGCSRICEAGAPVPRTGGGRARDQLVRAAMSVTSNIAEACGRGSVAEFRQFLLYARGSAQEALSQLGIARRLEPPMLTTVIRRLESRSALVIKQLGRLHDNPPRQRCRYAVAPTPSPYEGSLRLLHGFGRTVSTAPSTAAVPTRSPDRYTPATPRASLRRTARRCAAPARPAPRRPSRASPAPRAGPAAARRCGTCGAPGSSFRRCSC